LPDVADVACKHSVRHWLLTQAWERRVSADRLDYYRLLKLTARAFPLLPLQVRLSGNMGKTEDVQRESHVPMVPEVHLSAWKLHLQSAISAVLAAWQKKELCGL
jgi:hypothetical protein